MKRFLSVCTFIIILCDLFASHQTMATHSSQEGLIKIGVLADLSRNLSGTNQLFGYEIVNGIELAGRYLTKDTTSTRISYEVFDIRGTNANIPVKISEAIQKGIRFFIGLGSSDQAQIGKDAIRNTRAVLITPTATSDTLVEKESNLILMAPRNSLIVDDLVKRIVGQGIRTVGIVYAINSIYSRNITEEFIKKFVAAGGRIEAVYPVHSGIGSVEDDLHPVRNLKSDHLFLPLYELDAGRIIAYLQGNGIEKIYIGTDAWGTYSEAIHLLVDPKKFHALYIRLYEPKNDTSLSRWFLENYKMVHNRMPTDLAAFSFDAALLVSRIQKDCRMSEIGRGGINECLRKIRNLEGAVGRINNFYENSANRHVIITETVQRGLR